MATILIVDDDAENRTLLLAVLGWHGHRLLEAADGRHALEVLAREPVDLVITDLLMPGMDGFQLARRLAGFRAPLRPRVLFSSAVYSARDAMTLGRACGVLGIIQKPAEPEAILTIVSQALDTPAPARAATSAGFEQEHIRLLVARATHALGQKRATDDRLRLLQGFGAQLLAARSASDICRALCAAAREMALATDAAVGLYPSEADPEGLIVRGVLGGALFERSGFAGAVPDEPAHVVAGKQAWPIGRRLELSCDASAGVLAIPLDTASRRLGWLGVASKIGGRGFSASDSDVLAALVVQAAIALENAIRLSQMAARASDLAAEVAERGRAERRLRRAEERTTFALEANRIGLWELDITTGVVAHGTALLSLARRIGRPMAGSLSELLDQIVPEDRDRVVAGFADARAGQHPGVVEFRMKGSDGAVLWLEANAHVVRDDSGVPARIVGTLADVTDRRTLEAQLHEAQKMEAVGQLAGGIAHDFNNMLTAIVGYSDLLAATAANDTVREDVGEIRRAADRAATLTRQLLAFSRRQVLQLSVVDAVALVDGLVPMLRRLIGEDVDLRTSHAGQRWLVRTDPGQFEQVVLNLVVNARDAMPEGGTITVDTTRVRLDEAYCALHQGSLPGEYVRITVTDTGIGMNAATLEHMFEPFFTTKPSGKGTGLGLATVYGIVKQSGGNVWAYSEPGQGSTFKVYLPAAEEDEVASAGEAATAAPPSGWETVLLAEDEPAVRSYSSRVLRGLGYRVIEATDGEAALTLSRRAVDPIHLLLTDVVMPGLSGPSLHAALAKDRPQLKVLFMSGYPGDAIAARGFDPGCAFIEKPFASDALARSVRAVLDEQVA